MPKASRVIAGLDEAGRGPWAGPVTGKATSPSKTILRQCRMKQKMVLCGNYGAGNIGDEAILRALLQIFEKDYEVTVISANPIETHQKFGVPAVHQIPSGFRSIVRSWISADGRKQLRESKKAIGDCELFVLGGGTLLTDEPWQSMWIWGKQTKAALKQGKRLWIYRSGLGPLKGKWAKRWGAAILSHAKHVSVRDQKSAEWAKRLGREKIEIKRDPVFDLKLTNFHSKIDTKNTIIFVPRFWAKNIDELINSSKFFIRYLCLEKGKKVIGIPFESGSSKDRAILSTIFDQEGIKNQVEIWEDYTSEEEVIAAIQDADMVVGMRLHSLIFAEITNTPFIGISYMEKVEALGETLGKKAQIVNLEDISFDALKKAYKLAEKAR